ncbi:hypothetical protein [Carboxylicivirga sp. N1Y90]|uniref:hypothetical protein n=1 Tax=Carboxylicivirga fragile TaxID=3417571 RepID=UPI003D343F96|nr:hypothetical protein [Marinilabiliaceae bacterium N1Y90]
MAITEINRTIDWIDKEIRFKRTGSPIQLAGKLSMSVRMLYFYLDMMKSLGAQITYSKDETSFEYINLGHFKDGLKWIKD